MAARCSAADSGRVLGVTWRWRVGRMAESIVEGRLTDRPVRRRRSRAAVSSVVGVAGATSLPSPVSVSAVWPPVAGAVAASLGVVWAAGSKVGAESASVSSSGVAAASNGAWESCATRGWAPSSASSCVAAVSGAKVATPASEGVADAATPPLAAGAGAAGAVEAIFPPRAAASLELARRAAAMRRLCANARPPCGALGIAQRAEMCWSSSMSSRPTRAALLMRNSSSSSDESEESDVRLADIVANGDGASGKVAGPAVPVPVAQRDSAYTKASPTRLA